MNIYVAKKIIFIVCTTRIKNTYSRSNKNLKWYLISLFFDNNSRLVNTYDIYFYMYLILTVRMSTLVSSTVSKVDLEASISWHAALWQSFVSLLYLIAAIISLYIIFGNTLGHQLQKISWQYRVVRPN